MFQKYLERERKKQQEKPDYRIKRVAVPRTHAGEVSVQERVARDMKIPRLRTRALRTILRLPRSVLAEIGKDVLPGLLSLLLEKEGALLLRAVGRLAAEGGDDDLLLRYFKCYVFNDRLLAEQFLETLLRLRPGWVYERRAVLSALLPESGVRRRVQSMAAPPESTEIDTERISWGPRSRSE